MSRIDEPTDPGFVAHIARMVLDSHARGHRCQRCTDEGCTEPGWAQLMVRQMSELTGARRAAVADGTSGGNPTAGGTAGGQP